MSHIIVRGTAASFNTNPEDKSTNNLLRWSALNTSSSSQAVEDSQEQNHFIKRYSDGCARSSIRGCLNPGKPMKSFYYGPQNKEGELFRPQPMRWYYPKLLKQNNIEDKTADPFPWTDVPLNTRKNSWQHYVHDSGDIGIPSNNRISSCFRHKRRRKNREKNNHIAQSPNERLYPLAGRCGTTSGSINLLGRGIW